MHPHCRNSVEAANLLSRDLFTSEQKNPVMTFIQCLFWSIRRGGHGELLSPLHQDRPGGSPAMAAVALQVRLPVHRVLRRLSIGREAACLIGQIARAGSNSGHRPLHRSYQLPRRQSPSPERTMHGVPKPGRHDLHWRQTDQDSRIHQVIILIVIIVKLN